MIGILSKSLGLRIGHWPHLLVILTGHINHYLVSRQMWRKWSIWIPKEHQNGEKDHISHTFKLKTNKKEIYVDLKAVRMKNTVQAIKTTGAKPDLKFCLQFS